MLILNLEDNPINLENKMLQKTKEAHHLHQEKSTNREGKSKG